MRRRGTLKLHDGDGSKTRVFEAARVASIAIAGSAGATALGSH
jgi:hypothetical protein